MNIHEYQAKALLHEFGVPISRGVPVLKSGDADAAAKSLPGPIWVVKSQIHAGGRGKGKFKEPSAGDKGGVRIAKSVAEVNEFAKQMLGATLVTNQGQLRVLDAKVSFDDNAMYRHPEVSVLRDETEEDAKEIEASKHDLNYVTLDGTIGCMVNGAGLAMATMDIIKLYGMEPANFLDVGGGANKEKVAAAFKIITADPNVKGILINIFGGIMKCDIIAEGVVAAVKEVGLKVPLVVRLEGTNVDAGKKIIRESGLNVVPADNLDDAAQKIVKAVKGG